MQKGGEIDGERDENQTSWRNSVWMVLVKSMITHGDIVITGAEMLLRLDHVNAEAVALIAAGIDPTVIATDPWLLTTEQGGR